MWWRFATSNSESDAFSLPVISDAYDLSDRVRDHAMKGLGLYVRHSHGPEDDAKRNWTSINHHSMEEEKGLSVHPLWEPDDNWGEPIDSDRFIAEWHPQSIGGALALSPREKDQVTYLLRGRKVGYGSDYEPVIADVEPVAYVHRDLVSDAQESATRSNLSDVWSDKPAKRPMIDL